MAAKSSAPPPNLPCEQCGYKNEPERVYCHNCGAKLDRSLLPKPTEAELEHPEKARKRIAKITNPKSGGIGREIVMVFKVAIYSALLAAFLLIIQKPSDLPEIKKTDTPRLVSSDMMEALGSPGPARLSLSDDDINRYLKQILKPTDTAVPGIQLEQAYVACFPGVIRIFSQQSVLGLENYSRIDYHLEVKNGKFVPTIVGGAFGKLSVDPQLMQYCGAAFGTLFDALQREHKQMDKMLSVTVAEGRVDMVTKGLAAGR